MGLSFHDETSFVEAVSSLQFATDDPRTGSIGEERRDDDIGGSDDIQMIDGSI
jgi:hypothetical protein